MTERWWDLLHVWCFWETLTASHDCCFSMIHCVHVITALTTQSVISQAISSTYDVSTLCSTYDMSTLCIVLWSVYRGTVTRLPVFIETCSHMTDTKQKKCWHIRDTVKCDCSWLILGRQLKWPKPWLSPLHTSSLH